MTFSTRRAIHEEIEHWYLSKMPVIMELKKVLMILPEVVMLS